MQVDSLGHHAAGNQDLWIERRIESEHQSLAGYRSVNETENFE